jgi:hypothetical protein
LAAYTHYYGAMAVGVIYLMLLIHSICENRILIKNWILSTLFVVLCYFPWIFFVFFGRRTSYFSNDTQFKTPVPRDWIDSIIDFLFTPTYITHTHTHNDLTNWGLLFFICVVLLSVVLLMVLYILFKIIKDKDNSFNFIGLGGVFVLIAVMGFAYSFSTMGRSILVARYVFPMVGCLWLSLAVLLDGFYSKKTIFVPVLSIFLLVGTVSSVSFIDYEHDVNSSDLKFRYYMDRIDANDTILVLDVPFVRSDYNFYLDKEIIMIDNVSSHNVENKLEHTILKIKLKKGKVWVFNNLHKDFDGTNEFNNLLVKNGFKLRCVNELSPTYVANFYPHNIYLIDPLE